MDAEASTGILTAAEVATYRREGFLVPRYRLPRRDLTKFSRAVRRVVEAYPHFEHKPIPSPHCVSSRRHGIETDGALIKFAIRSEIVDMVAELSGPDVTLWSTSIFHKPAEVGKRTPSHRDDGGWPIEPVAAATVWIAGTQSGQDNGCLKVIPGSHLRRTIGSHRRLADGEAMNAYEIEADEVDPALAVDVELAPGQMVLFDCRLIHGGNANRAAAPRTGFTARCMPGSSYFNHDRGDEGGSALRSRALFLLQGEDRARNELIRNVYPEDRELLRAPAALRRTSWARARTAAKLARARCSFPEPGETTREKRRRLKVRDATGLGGAK